ncbi:MAG: hypothetical protein WC607_03030 [Candidatus Micrarchaeia archaeon]
MDYVFVFNAADKGKVQAVLDADSFGAESFARLGYDFKDAKVLGLPAGKYVLHFKKEGDASKLVAALKAVESFAEATADEKKRVLAELEAGLDNAAQGFGSIFG